MSFDTFVQISGAAANWASAIATGAASIIALWLGTADARRRANESRLMGDTVRALLELELHAVAVAAEKLPAALASIRPDPPGSQNDDGHIAFLRFTASRLVTPAAQANFAQLIHLGERESQLVAAVVGETVRLKRTLEDWTEHYAIMDRREAVIDSIEERAVDIAQAIRLLPWAAKERD
jgi:hypothetical protein